MLSVQTTKLPRHRAGLQQPLKEEQKEEHTMYGTKLLEIMDMLIQSLFA